MKYILYIILLIIVGNIIVGLIAKATLASNPALLGKALDEYETPEERHKRIAEESIAELDKRHINR